MRPAIRRFLPAATFAIFAATSLSAYAALGPAHPGPTVNDYTAADLDRAQAAAQAAGYKPLEVTTAQAGNFFMKGEKAGQTFFLTVTPDGKVYPSAPLPPISG